MSLNSGYIALIGQLSHAVIGRLSVKLWCYWLWRLVMSLVCFDQPIVTFKQLIFCWCSKIHCFSEYYCLRYLLCLKQALKKGVISVVLYQPWNEMITVTLNRTALWLTNCWTTQGGIRSLSPSSLNITAIWNEVTFNQSKKEIFAFV